MRQFARFAAERGIALDSLLDEQLLQMVQLAEVQSRIPDSALIDVLDRCAIATHNPTLGIEFANWIDLHGFGLFCLLADHCTTLSEAVRISQRYRHLETTALDAGVKPVGNETMIHYSVASQTRHGGGQSVEFMLAIAIRVSRTILGEQWRPLRVELQRPEPADRRRHAALLGCPVRFGSERSAYFIRPQDLFTHSNRGNPQVLEYLMRQLDSFERENPEQSSAEVSRIIAQDLPSGRATLKRAAAATGVTPRTLQRRLAAEGTEFSVLVEQIRRQLAERYFQTERNPQLSSLAIHLGYSEASAVSRFLQRQFGSGLRGLARGVVLTPDMPSEG